MVGIANQEAHRNFYVELLYKSSSFKGWKADESKDEWTAFVSIDAN